MQEKLNCKDFEKLIEIIGYKEGQNLAKYINRDGSIKWGKVDREANEFKF